MREFIVFIALVNFALGLFFMYLRVFGKENYFAGFDSRAEKASWWIRILSVLFINGVLSLMITGFCVLLLMVFF